MDLRTSEFTNKQMVIYGLKCGGQFSKESGSLGYGLILNVIILIKNILHYVKKLLVSKDNLCNITQTVERVCRSIEGCIKQLVSIGSSTSSMTVPHPDWFQILTRTLVYPGNLRNYFNKEDENVKLIRSFISTFFLL